MSENRRRSGRREKGGSGARRALRSRRFSTAPLPYIQRNIPVFDVLSEEGLEIIENNAEVIMEEVGISIKDDPATVAMWKEAGADVAPDGREASSAPGPCPQDPRIGALLVRAACPQSRQERQDR